MMDEPIEVAIKRAEKHLKDLKSGKSVFTCPKCGKKFSNLMNYEDLKMCGKCFSDFHTKKQKELASVIIGGVITAVGVKKIDVYDIVRGRTPTYITAITVVKDGKTYQINKKEDVLYLL